MTAARNSTVVSSLSALVLTAAGITLLFAPDAVLPRIVPGLSAGAAPLGQLIAAGWLAVAWLDWSQRGLTIGGIYGRPTVLANFALYFISSFSLARPAMTPGASLWLQLLALAFAAFALVYAALLMRGPFGSLTTVET